MNKVLISLFGGGEYWVRFWGTAQIGDLVAVGGGGVFKLANQNDATGVVIKTEVPLGCLDVFDEVGI